MSSTQTLRNPHTLAASVTFDAAAYGGVTFFATGLGVGESIPVLVGGGPVAVPACHSDGTPVTLTDAAPSVFVEGGPLYQLDKPATVGNVGLYAAPKLA